MGVQMRVRACTGAEGKLCQLKNGSHSDVEQETRSCDLNKKCRCFTFIVLSIGEFLNRFLHYKLFMYFFFRSTLYELVYHIIIGSPIGRLRSFHDFFYYLQNQRTLSTKR